MMMAINTVDNTTMLSMLCKLQFVVKTGPQDTHQHTSSKGVTTTTTIKSHVNVISRANVAAVRPFLHLLKKNMYLLMVY